MTASPLDDVRAHYSQGEERARLESPLGKIEFARTVEIVRRHLPPPPAVVADIGGGPGRYALWLADSGYQVRHRDLVGLHVEQLTADAAADGLSVETAVGDARSLDLPDDCVDAVLLLGPLYHLTERVDRMLALREARRVLRPGGLVAAAAISRFASALDGMYAGYLSDPEFWPIVQQDLADGQHRSGSSELPAFTTAFFHRPEELVAEVREAGLELEALLGVEGPGWLLADRLDDPVARDHILQVGRLLEGEPSTIGTSAHLLAIGRAS